jgi:hypothetical protein
MRRHILPGKLRVAITRALALMGAAIALTCGSLFFLAGIATPAVAACGDGVTYQAAMAADSCPDTGAGKAVGVAAGVAGGAAAAMFARVIVRSAASGGDLAAMEKELVSVELVSREAATVQKSYPGAADLAELGAQLEAADEYGEGAESSEQDEEAFDSADITETVAKGGIEAGKTDEEPWKPTEPVPTSQVAVTSVNPYPHVYTPAEPDLINPVRDITMLIVAGHQAVVWAKNGRFRPRGGHGE